MHRSLLIILVLVFPMGSIFAKGRRLSLLEPQLYYEILYEVGLFYANKPLNEGFEKTKGIGIKKMPWQPIDDEMRKVFHPDAYGTGPTDDERPFNHGSDTINRMLAYYAVGAIPFNMGSDLWVGSGMTVVHMIESTFYLNTFLRTLFARFRPRSIYSETEVNFEDVARNSFPSVHASQAFA